MTGIAYPRILDALGAHGSAVRDNGTTAMAQCPAHEDRNPSLSIRHIEGSVLVRCFAECSIEDVLAALNLAKADLYDDAKGATYRYDNGRVVHRSPAKTFHQSGNTKGTPQLYRLAEVVAAVAEGTTVYLVEGEKDVHALESLGAVATTAPMGAANFAKADVSPLRGATVVVVADRDPAGEKWLADVLAAVVGIAAAVEVRAPKIGKDAADHVAAGYTAEEFVLMEEPACIPPRRLLFTRASSITPRPVWWAWDTAPAGSAPAQGEGRLPVGALGLAVGRAGIGKSQFAAWMAARITRGELTGHYFGTPRGVVYAAAEDSWQMTIVPRLMAAGADLDLVFRVDVTDDLDPHASLTLPTDTAILEDGIVAHGVALVVLDPLLSMVDERVNDYRAREVRAALEPLIRVADRTRVLMLGIAHFTKATGTDPLMLVSGSAAFGQLIRAGLGFARDDEADDGTFVMSTIKNNLGREDLPSLAYQIEPAAVATPEGEAWVSRLVFTGEPAERSVGDLLRGRTEDPDERGERDDAAAWLRGYLTDCGGEATAKDVLKAARGEGIAEHTLKRSKHRAGVRSVKSGMNSGWVWTIESAEGDTKGTKGTTSVRVHSSSPSVSPSEPCQVSDGQDGQDGQVRVSESVLTGVLTAVVAADRFGNPLCSGCQGPLYTAESITRGHCGACDRAAS